VEEMKVYYALRSADWKIEHNDKMNYYALMADNYIRTFNSDGVIPGYLQNATWTIAHPIHYYKLIKMILRGKIR
jgi:hypothetical protein